MRSLRELLSSIPLLQCVIMLAIFSSSVHAGPVHKRPRRMMREIYSDIDTSHQNETNFLDTCLYEGAQNPRSAVTCEKKHGCRAIQKTGQCCPDYQCECQRDGKIYGNGEKLFDPETPCRVCYCQGGEITCSQVTCYIRNDCEPKYITGRCCPEFDNCPPLENSKITGIESTSPKDYTSNELKENISDITTNDGFDNKINADTTTTTTQSSTFAGKITTQSPSSSEMHQKRHDNPLGIKIKETTKAEEIRITDDRPNIMKINKDKTSTTSKEKFTTEDSMVEKSEQAETSTRQHEKQTSGEQKLKSNEEINNLEHLDVNFTGDGEDGSKNVRHTDDDVMLSNESYEGSVLGENKLYSSTSADSNEGSTGGPRFTNESGETIEVRDVAETYSSEPSIYKPYTSTTFQPDMPDEVTEKEKPLPAVVQIGDKLVIVDHNQPKPITVIQVEEVEGLQRGEDDISYDQEMDNERLPEGREISKNMKIENVSIRSGSSGSTRSDSGEAVETAYHSSKENLSSEEIFDTQHYTEEPFLSSEHQDSVASETAIDTLSASSEEFIQVISSSIKPARLEEEYTTQSIHSSSITEEGSTAGYQDRQSTSSEASGDEIFETILYTEGPSFSSETTDDAKETGSTEEILVSSSAEEAFSSTETKDKDVTQSDDSQHMRKTFIEEDEIPNHELIAPGYPSIPEDVSLLSRDGQSSLIDMNDELYQNSPQPTRSDDHYNKDFKILAEVLEHRSNASVTSTESVDINENEVTNAPEWLKENFIKAKEQIMLRSPGEPHLVPEWERNNSTNSSEETDVFSGTGEYNLLKMSSDEFNDSQDLENGSGYSSKREAELTTTPKVSLDIDSTSTSDQSDSIKHNPKNDVESLKAEENDNASDDALPHVKNLESNRHYDTFNAWRTF